jgi:hypothetical protein
MASGLTHRYRGRRNLRALLQGLYFNPCLLARSLSAARDPVGAQEQRDSAMTAYLTLRHRGLALLGGAPPRSLLQHAAERSAVLNGSTHQMQELHVPLVLVEDVVDDLFLGVAHQIVILTALAQVHLGAVVATIVQLFGAHATAGE